MHSSFVEGGWLQEDPIVTNLPYLYKQIHLPSEIGDDEDVALMISEDTLIALEKVNFALYMFVS